MVGWRMAKRPKKGELLEYAYFILYDNWPKICKKLGIDKDALTKPTIDFTSRVSEYDSSKPEFIKLEYKIVLDAYKKKVDNTLGLKVKCEELLKEDIIHECVHYVQDGFYDIEHLDYTYAREGLAALVAIDIQLNDKEYNIATSSIAEFFIETKKRYKDYFGLPKKYNEHIKKILKKGKHKPLNRSLDYAKGIFYICEDLKRCDNYLHMLIEPFKNSDVDIED